MSTRWARSGVVAALVVLAGLGPAAAQAAVPVATPGLPKVPTLYYTTNATHELKAAPYSLSGGVLSIGQLRVIATLPAADGLAFASDGDLLVGGQKTGMVFKVHPQTGAYTAQPTGIANAYHVTVSPDGSFAWTAGLPGQLAKVPLKPFGPGTPVVLRGDDLAVSTIGFTPLGAFYTQSDSFGSGNFGTFDPATGTTKRTLTDQRGAHGFAYDSFSQNLLLFGSYEVVQIDPAHPATVASIKDVPHRAFDQGIADGNGHVLVASNEGHVSYLDYSASGKIGDKTTSKSEAFLDTNLDDLAVYNPPGTSPGGATVAHAAGGMSKKTKLVVLLVVVGLIVAGYLTARKRLARQA
jgi:hypothetical protein